MVTVEKGRCNGCRRCARACPFGSISFDGGGYPEIDSGCKLCGLCVKACNAKALSLGEHGGHERDLARYGGFLVFLEQEGGRLHPVSLEMAGEALLLKKAGGEPLVGFLAGAGLEELAHSLLAYGFDAIELYDDETLRHFTAGAYTGALVDCVKRVKPSVVLVGATPIGRCLAPAAATRLKTGVTADCTSLDMDADGRLIQTRPAFGGNIMARIVTPYTRPQFATVRYKVMDKAPRTEPHGLIYRRALPKSVVPDALVESVTRLPPVESICDARVLVAAGRGLAKKQDLDVIRKLAELLGGTYAVTRPLVESGWAEQTRQIGLSGRSVKPDLLLAVGISGAVQFTSAIAGAQQIVAVNTDSGADIMKAAHVGLVGDLYEIVPRLIDKLEKGGALL